MLLNEVTADSKGEVRYSNRLICALIQHSAGKYRHAIRNWAKERKGQTLVWNILPYLIHDLGLNAACPLCETQPASSKSRDLSQISVV